MQILLWDRETVSGVSAVETPSVDVQGGAVIQFSLTVHMINGTSPTFSAQLQTSDDLETWKDIGTVLSASTVDYYRDVVDIKTDKYGRYVRLRTTLAGTDPVVNVTIALNTFQSS